MYNTSIQYMNYVQPSFAPPSSWFGPVWTALYIIIAISFGFVLYKAIKKEISFLVALPFVLNLVFNALYTTLQFGLQNFVLASIDIVLVLGTLIWAMIAVWKEYKLTDIWGIEMAAVNGGWLQWAVLFMFYALGVFVADTIIHLLFAIAPEPIKWED
jgi:tryptophan-rich sensory protein